MDRPGSKNLAGTQVAGTLNTETQVAAEVYALLAQANLLRMRGEWDSAAQACMTALKLAPDSSSANSLLGDIYENQGRYDDAAQWYLMALDAHPDSPADLLKLARLRQREEGQRGSVLGPAGTGTMALPPQGVLRHLARDPERALRVGAIAAAAGLILVVLFAYLAAHRHSGFSFGHDAVVKISPVEVPPQAGVLPTDPDAAPAHDPSEESLLTTLQSAPALSRMGIVVYDVEADPRAGRVTVTFGVPPSEGMTQAEMAQDALAVLQTAGGVPSVEVYTARGLLVTPGGSPDASLAFVGDTTRGAVQAAGTAAADAPALSVFSNVWWSATANIRA